MKTTISFVLVAFLILLGSSKTDNVESVFTLQSISSDVNSEHHKLARDVFKELIEINTTYRYGSTKAAEAMALRLKSAGFPAGDIQVIGPDLQHKNLVFRFRGNGKLKPVLFICHLDVVEALREDWSVDPFTFLEKDGYFYGRGTTDIKNGDASLIVSLIRLKKEEYIQTVIL
jgi:acetylornithine deacetylase/succinyl-diaminopimelate desuccinylase-like protein